MTVTVSVSVTCLCWSLGHAEQLLFSCVSSKVSICNYVTCHILPFTCHMLYVVVTTQGKLSVSWHIICCPKLQKHIECTWVISFWFSCMWQLEPTIVWCFAWSHYRGNDNSKKNNTYFGAFLQSHQRTSQYCNIQKNHILVVNDSPRTISQSSFTCSFDW